MAKQPTAGKVKTRLSPPLTPVEAVDLYRCFLQDRLLAMSAMPDAEVAIAYTPARARTVFADCSPENFHLFAQRGKDLGDKLTNIFREKLSEGYAAVSVMGSDSPDMPNRLVRSSFELMLNQRVDLVLGPSPDGGYYLVGAKKLYPELFADVPWSTDKVLVTTLEKAARLGLQTELLPPWNDLDTFQDLVLYHQNYLHRKIESDVAGKITYSFLVNLWSRPPE